MPSEAIKQWTMPSSTNPAKKYTVQMHVDGSFSCNCPRWIFKKVASRICPHIIGIKSVLRLDEVDDIIRSPQPVAKRKITFVGD